MNAVWRSRLAMLLAVQNVVVSIDSASHMMARSPEQGETKKDAKPGAGRARLRNCLIAHSRCVPLP